MPRETEAKIPVANLAAVRERLAALGAVNEGRALERNWVLDFPDESLRREGKLLRVRSLGSVGGVLTVKRPLGGGEFKTREEIECMVDSHEDVLQQFAALGYQIMWIYEKDRATWLWHDCVIALDELPEIGSFVEIEGEPGNIREVAGKIGLDANDHLDDNYLGLWEKHLKARGENHRNMVFSADKAKEKSRSGRFATRIAARDDD